MGIVLVLGVLIGLPLLPKGGVWLLTLKSHVGGKESLLYSRYWPLWRDREGRRLSKGRLPPLPHWQMLLVSPCGMSWRCSKLSMSSHKTKLGMFARTGHLTTKRTSHTQAKWKALLLLPLLCHSCWALEEPRTDDAEEELEQGGGGGRTSHASSPCFPPSSSPLGQSLGRALKECWLKGWCNKFRFFWSLKIELLL